MIFDCESTHFLHILQIFRQKCFNFNIYTDGPKNSHGGNGIFPPWEFFCSSVPCPVFAVKEY